ncbi:MAG: response regulator transcription factor [Paludibacter sp.]
MQPNQLKVPDIILVEDHLIFRRCIKSIINFENIGTIIGEASDGEEFMQLISTSKPDLVLMDIDMPGMNGFEATKNALELNPELKIIAFTAFANADYCKKMIELGARGYILKSTDLNELEAAILKVVKGGYYFFNNFPEISDDDVDYSKPLPDSGDEHDQQKKNAKIKFFCWNRPDSTSVFAACK